MKNITKPELVAVLEKNKKNGYGIVSVWRERNQLRLNATELYNKAQSDRERKLVIDRMWSIIRKAGYADVNGDLRYTNGEVELIKYSKKEKATIITYNDAMRMIHSKGKMRGFFSVSKLIGDGYWVSHYLSKGDRDFQPNFSISNGDVYFKGEKIKINRQNLLKHGFILNFRKRGEAGHVTIKL